MANISNLNPDLGIARLGAYPPPELEERKRQQAEDALARKRERERKHAEERQRLLEMRRAARAYKRCLAAIKKDPFNPDLWDHVDPQRAAVLRGKHYLHYQHYLHYLHYLQY